MDTKYGPYKVNKYSVYLYRQILINTPHAPGSEIPAAQIVCTAILPIEKALTITRVSLEINLWCDGAEKVRQNQTSVKNDAVIGSLHLPADQYIWYLDLLRNEQTYLFVNESRPDGNSLSSDVENAAWGHAEEV